MRNLITPSRTLPSIISSFDAIDVPGKCNSTTKTRKFVRESFRRSRLLPSVVRLREAKMAAVAGRLVGARSICRITSAVCPF